MALATPTPCTPGALLTLRALSTLTPTSCPPAPRPRCGTTDPRARPQLYSSWHSLSRVWTERNGRLEEQLQAALSYQDTMQVGAGALRQIPHGWGCVTFPSPLRGARGHGAPQPHPRLPYPQRLLEWLDAAELRIAEEFLVGGDLDMVQQQLAELKVPRCATPDRAVPRHALITGAGRAGGALGRDGMEGWRVGQCWCHSAGRWGAKSCLEWPSPVPQKPLRWSGIPTGAA